MLAGELDFFHKINQDNINSCIDEILKHTKRTESCWICEGERKENNLENLSAVDLICTLDCCRARAKLGGMRFGQLVFSAWRPEPMFWHLLPAPVNWWSSVQAAFSQRTRMD